MADLGLETGHARRFCQTSCEDCVYYRRVNRLPTCVLVITADEGVPERLAKEENESIAVRVAHNAYDASAIIHDFRPAFVVVDEGLLAAGEGGLLDSLASDPRVPGLRIILAVSPSRTGRKRDRAKSSLIDGVIEAPFTLRQIADVINTFPVDSLPPGDRNMRATTGKEER
jgi:hypothetical protein